MRIGTQYRIKSFKTYGAPLGGGHLLDIGCHDGAFLSSLSGNLRVGIDLEPTPPVANDIVLMQADGEQLPFCDGCFDCVIATDVIEHLADPVSLVREMARVTRKGGKLFLTTPSVHICIFPTFLTSWVSIKWGHYWRRGYTSEELFALLCREYSCECQEWNAPAYRFFYLPLRAMSVLCPSLTYRFLDWISRYDFRHSTGNQGFYWMWCIKN